MIRIMPDMQVGPFGYLLTWLLIIVAVVGVVFATGLGGAVAWLLFWVAVAILVYVLWKRVFGRVV